MDALDLLLCFILPAMGFIWAFYFFDVPRLRLLEKMKDREPLLLEAAAAMPEHEGSSIVFVVRVTCPKLPDDVTAAARLAVAQNFRCGLERLIAEGLSVDDPRVQNLPSRLAVWTGSR